MYMLAYCCWFIIHGARRQVSYLSPVLIVLMSVKETVGGNEELLNYSFSLALATLISCLGPLLLHSGGSLKENFFVCSPAATSSVSS